MPARSQEIAMLAILQATCETAVQAFQAADNPIDVGLVADLEKMVERTRKRIATLRAEESPEEV
jgi:hypothetical protein